jgi:inorganic pyrophosphatase
MTKLLQKAERFEIQAYQRPSNLHRLRESHVSFDGSPHKHPHDPEKVVLVSDPLSAGAFYYEFHRSDIAFAEELPSLTNPEQETVSCVRIWVKKGAVGVRCTPFLVADLSRHLR